MARKMIAAFELPENRDKGVIQIDGRMVERLHAEMAQRTVAIADAIAKAKQKQPAKRRFRCCASRRGALRRIELRARAI